MQAVHKHIATTRSVVTGVMRALWARPTVGIPEGGSQPHRASRGARAAGALCALGLSAAAAAPGWAQGNADAAHCEVAARVIATGLPAHKFPDAQVDLAGCPAGTYGDAYAAAMRRLRTETDTAALMPVYVMTVQVRDAGMFGAAADVAADPGASALARVLALRVFALSAGDGFSFDVVDIGRRTAADLAGGCAPRGWIALSKRS